MNKRRNFLKAGFLSSVIFIVSKGELFGATTILQTLEVMQKDLFPQANDTPSFEQINPNKYLLIIFSHSKITQESKDYLRNGVAWVNEEAVELFGKTYTQLSAFQRQKVLISISSHDWGKDYMDTVLSYLMEALLGDSIYGVNKNGSGWKWLNHESGQPRPKKAYL